MCDLPTPMTKSRPEEAVASAKCRSVSWCSNFLSRDMHLQLATAMLLSTPVHSIVTAGITSLPIPAASLNSFTISRAACCGSVVGLTVYVNTLGTRFLANSRRSADRSVIMMGEQPEA